MNLIKRFIRSMNFPANWERIDKVPKWVKYPLVDGLDFIFYVKGKNYRYKIQVYNYKTMVQTEKVWRKRRRK